MHPTFGRGLWRCSLVIVSLAVSGCAESTQSAFEETSSTDQTLSLAEVWQNPSNMRQMIRVDLGAEFFWAPLTEADYLHAPKKLDFVVAANPVPGTIPVYRLSRDNRHSYIINPALRSLLLSWNFRDEGIMGYIYSAPQPGLVALRSLVEATTQVRYLTVSATDATQFLATHPTFALENTNSGIIGYVIPPSLPLAQVGILYEPWHCVFPDPTSTPPNKNYNMTNAAAGLEPWGPLFKFHWRDRPAAGYYCLSRDIDVAYKHAIQLRDAGVDFIIYDSSNSPYTSDAAYRSVSNNSFWDPTNNPEVAVKSPLATILAVWNLVPGAPKIVPFVPTKNDPPPGARTVTGVNCPKPDMPVLFDWMLRPGTGLYRDMAFNYLGKPLWLAANGPLPLEGECLNQSRLYSDSAAVAQYKSVYTVRKLWGFLPQQGRGSDPEEWSFKERCQDSFRGSLGFGPCNQFMTPGEEQLSVSGAYQDPKSNVPLMSHAPTAVPKFLGRTFDAQLAKVFRHPKLKIVTVNGWNEWGAVRAFCAAAGWGCSPDGNNILVNGREVPVFFDEYAGEYGADFEPGTRDGDRYYQQLIRGITSIKGRPYIPVRTPGTIAGRIVAASSGTVTGWACNYGNATPVAVDIYVGGPYPIGTYVGRTTANQAYTASLAEQCGGTNSTRGFSFTFSPGQRASYAGKSIYAHGIATVAGFKSHILESSSRYKVTPLVVQ